MRRGLIMLLVMLLTLPMAAQKLSKEEKAALAKAKYEKALSAINANSFVIVPASYQTSGGDVETNTDNSNLLLVQGKQVFLQGRIVCDNTYNNVAEPTEYDVKVDKKGNIKLKMVVQGRMVKGTYTISVRNNGNNADVIFNPQSGGTTRRFTGPLTPPSETSYNKRANPM